MVEQEFYEVDIIRNENIQKNILDWINIQYWLQILAHKILFGIWLFMLESLGFDLKSTHLELSAHFLTDLLLKFTSGNSSFQLGFYP